MNGCEPAERGLEPIAVTAVGLALPCRIDSPAQMWKAMCDGVDVLDGESTRPPLPTCAEERYELTQKEHELLDPQQLLLLHATERALRGLTRSPDSGKSTGVFVAVMNNDHEINLCKRGVESPYALTGAGKYSASGRLSYVNDWWGPSMTVDTACSASLVAIHLACQSLRSGECDFAFAGGSNVIMSQHVTRSLDAGGLLSARSRFGSSLADGFARGQGAAIIGLQRLQDAIESEADIRAVILGSAVNHNGRSSSSLVRPSESRQVALLRRAYRSARVDPGQVSYVECHGTGTAVGDAIEIEALGKALGQAPGRTRDLRIGSIKSNLGHLEAAAGVVGVVKACLSLQHRFVPPTLHSDPLRRDVDWKRLRIAVERDGGPLRATQPALVGVSAFGLSGTNAHVVLGSAREARSGFVH